MTRSDKEINIIKTAIDQVKNAGYKPTDVWLLKDGKTVCVSTDNIDRSKFATKLNIKYY